MEAAEVNAQIKALQQRQRRVSARRQPLQEDAAALALNAAPAEVRAAQPADEVGLPSSRSTKP